MSSREKQTKQVSTSAGCAVTPANLLRAPSHVRIQDEEGARSTRLLLLGLVQWLCLKFIIRANDEFKPL